MSVASEPDDGTYRVNDHCVYEEARKRPLALTFTEFALPLGPPGIRVGGVSVLHIARETHHYDRRDQEEHARLRDAALRLTE
jgi:hypothetical protein